MNAGNVGRVSALSRSADLEGLERRLTLARSLQDARDNVETLRLYAKSIVRMLEYCEAEAGSQRKRVRLVNGLRQAPTALNLDFVRADVDRLVGETQAHLALLGVELQNCSIR